MNKYMKIATILLSLYIAVALTACKSQEADLNKIQNSQNTTETEKKQESIESDTLRLSIANPATLDPLTNKDLSIDQLLRLSFDSLFIIDSQQKPVPKLVNSYEFNSENSLLTLVLKDNIKFTNNEPISATDVVFSINQIKASESTIYKECISNIQRAVAIDNKTVKLYLKRPSILTLYNLYFPIVSQKNYLSADFNSFQPVGSGAFKISEFTTMKAMKMTLSENARESYNIKNIEITIARDNESEANILKQNLIDISFPMKFDWNSFSEDSNRKISTYTTNNIEIMGYNFSNEKLKNPQIRIAIAKAINRKEMSNKLLVGRAIVADRPIHPESWLMPKDKDSLIEYDKAAARKSIELMNFVDADNDGLYDDFSLRLLVSNDNSLRIKQAELIKEYLNQIGIKIEIISTDKAGFNTKLDKGEFDLYLTGWKLSAVPDFSSILHSGQIKNGENYINYSNKEMDSILTNIVTSKDDVELYNNILQFYQKYDSELPYLPIYFIQSAVVANKDVKGKLEPDSFNVLSGIDAISIQKGN